MIKLNKILMHKKQNKKIWIEIWIWIQLDIILGLEFKTHSEQMGFQLRLKRAKQFTLSQATRQLIPQISSRTSKCLFPIRVPWLVLSESQWITGRPQTPCWYIKPEKVPGVRRNGTCVRTQKPWCWGCQIGWWMFTFEALKHKDKYLVLDLYSTKVPRSNHD